MKRLALLLALAPTAALAQAPDNFTLTVTQQDIAEIGHALGSMPYNDVVALIAKLDAQVRAQQARKAEPPKEPPK